MTEKIGLIAGSGQLPVLFARAAKAQGLSVIAVGHQGETNAAPLQPYVDSLSWARVGQVDAILRVFQRAGVKKAVMAGGIGRVKAITDARPDWGTLRVLAKLRSFRDDSLLRAIASVFEEGGVEIVAPTAYVKEVLAPVGRLAGPPLTAMQEQDVKVGIEVARRLGAADVGQTVVVRQGLVLALEAVEGTDEAIKRGCSLGGPGAVVVKLLKPGQDERFDLPAVGPRTLQVLAEGRGRVLAFQAEKTVLLDSEAALRLADEHGITLWGLGADELRS